MFLGVAKISSTFGVLEIPDILGVNGRCWTRAYVEYPPPGCCLPLPLLIMGMGMGIQNSRAFQDFFIFQGLNFFSNLYNTTFKSALFQPEASKCKGALDFFDSDTSDKNRDYRTNWIV